MHFARISRCAAAGFMAMAILIMLSPSAQAAAYPPQPGPTAVLGEMITVNVCGLTPGSSVTVQVNGQPAGSVTVNAGGCAPVPVTVNSTSQSTVNGMTVSTACGSNTVTAGGATATFTISCIAATNAPAGGIAFSGANILPELLFAGTLFLIGIIVIFAYRRRVHTEL